MDSQVFQFQAGSISGRVDRGAGVIRGAAVITGGVTARGHDLEVDDTTLKQIVTCGNAKGRVQVKLNHKDPQALQSICGYLEGFRREGNKVVADWHLLKSHEEFDALMERAERMSDCFGLSAAFAGPPKGEKRTDGKNAARCAELLAVDCVAMPAANPSGLFEAAVDTATKEKPMNDNIEQNTGTEPSLAEVIDAVRELQEVVTSVANRQAEVDALIESETPLSLDELAELDGMSDEELAEQGITRAELNNLIANVAATDGDGDEAGAEGEGELAGAVAGESGNHSAVSGEVGSGAALSSLQRRIVELESKLAAQEQNDEATQIQHAFDVLEQKQAALIAQNESLQRIVRLHGIHAATAGVEGIKMFSAGDNVTEFDRIVTAKAAEFETAGKGKGTARAEAIRFAIKTNPRAYAESLSARGIIKLADD
jgi:hypothetical protein